MNVVDMPIECLTEAPWNPNSMDQRMLFRLRESIRRFGLVGILVVRSMLGDLFEVLSGNQRLGILREMGYKVVPCVIVDLEDGPAKLLAQALNHINGQDDLGLRAELLRDILRSISQEDVLSILPETSHGLSELSSLGQEDLAAHLEAWQKAQNARLETMQFQLTVEQKGVVDEALKLVMPEAKQYRNNSPNTRGTALYLLCKSYLQGKEPR